MLNSFPICKGSGKLPSGTTEIPFVFDLQGDRSGVLYETYHGVYISIQYFIKVEMKRGILAKDLEKTCEFIVEHSVSIHNKFYCFISVALTCFLNKGKIYRKELG